MDLVRAQLLVASGEPLPWRQADLDQRGHAIEARVYAEDPEHGFLPQAGRLLLYREPRMPGVRIDSGVREGDDISVHYDPLIAKVIAQAETRDLAIARLIAALREFPVLGIITNIPFLIRVLEHPSFRRVRCTPDSSITRARRWLMRSTNRRPRLLPQHCRRPTPGADQPAASQPADWDPWSRLQGWRA